MLEPLLFYGLCCSVVTVEQGYALHSVEELTQQIALIGAVYGVALQAESHKERVKSKNFLELSQDGDAATSAAWYGFYAIDLCHGT